MSWDYSDFQKWITSGCQKDIAQPIDELDISGNNLVSEARLNFHFNKSLPTSHRLESTRNYSRHNFQFNKSSHTRPK